MKQYYVLHRAHAYVSSCVVPRCPLSKPKPNRGSAYLVPQVNICTVHKQELSELRLSPSPMPPYAAELRVRCPTGPFAVWSVKNSMMSE